MLRKSILGLLACLVINAYADQASLHKVIEATLEAECLDSAQTAISIVGAPNGNVVYTRNTDVPLLPASIIKLLTTAAALEYLGPEYRFKTDILYTGVRRESVIEGDLILRGGGDPMLTSAQLRHMAEQIYQSGIRQITGRLLVDTSFFDDLDRAPAWSKQRTQRPYDANLSALSLNFNNVTVYARPAETRGHQPVVWLDPPPSYMRLDNKSKTVSANSKHTIWASRRSNSDEITIRVRGNLPEDVEERAIFINVANPTRFTAESFRVFLLQSGVNIIGETVLNAPTPNGAALLHQHVSTQLSVILKELNTYSNNFIAEQIIKTIAAEVLGPPGSHANGLSLVKRFLTNLGVNTQGIVLADGSGLSRDNLLTAQAMTDFLTAILSRFDIGPDFMAAIRVMGANGVMSKRLKNSPAHAQVRAKTGSLFKVSNLAGYVAGRNGSLYAYTFMLNNNKCGYRGADRLEDRIINAIHTLDSGKQPDMPLVSSLWQKQEKSLAQTGLVQ
jgi:D-alanyl-D-alanine carboxypeptidase/D-alanyl-D-alanine-endopeptidase (penicillin-binding protein 4)